MTWSQPVKFSNPISIQVTGAKKQTVPPKHQYVEQSFSTINVTYPLSRATVLSSVLPGHAHAPTELINVHDVNNITVVRCQFLTYLYLSALFCHVVWKLLEEFVHLNVCVEEQSQLARTVRSWLIVNKNILRVKGRLLYKKCPSKGWNSIFIV